MNPSSALSNALADLQNSVKELEKATKELKQAQVAHAAAVRVALNSSSGRSARARS